MQCHKKIQIREAAGAEGNGSFCLEVLELLHPVANQQIEFLRHIISNGFHGCQEEHQILL